MKKRPKCIVSSCDNTAEYNCYDDTYSEYCLSCKPGMNVGAASTGPITTQSEALGLKAVETPPFPLRPLEDLVFVKRTKKDKMYGSIVIADSIEETPKTSGEIMAIGPGKFSETLGRIIQPRVEVGQKVVFSKHANMAIDIEGIIPEDGEEYLVMHADELIAVITGEGGASLAPEPALKVRAI